MRKKKLQYPRSKHLQRFKVIARNRSQLDLENYIGMYVFDAVDKASISWQLISEI